jgi:hypothetical protein
MQLGRIIKQALLTEIAVAAALAIWIFTRGNSLIALSKDMADSFMAPRNMGDVMMSGLAIWVPVSLVLGLLAGLIFYLVSRKWHWRRAYFAAFVLGLGLLVSVMAFATGMAYKVEATGEIMIVALGYGILMPWLVAGQK